MIPWKLVTIKTEQDTYYYCIYYFILFSQRLFKDLMVWICPPQAHVFEQLVPSWNHCLRRFWNIYEMIKLAEVYVRGQRCYR